MMREGDVLIQSEDGSDPKFFKRRVVKTHEVPFTKKEKVKIMIKKLVETEVQKRVKRKALKEVVEVEEVKEKYTVFVDQKCQREKKIWVEETIMEDYMKRVSVTKTRLIKKPMTRIVERDCIVTVQVSNQKVEVVDAFRIDAIQDMKQVESVEWELYDLVPRSTGEIIKGEEKDLGRLKGSNNFGGPCRRNRGTQFYESGFDDLSEDDDDLNDPIPHTMMSGSGPRGFTNVPADGNKAAPQEDKPAQSSAPRQEGFNLQKCLAYVRKELGKQPADLDVNDFVDELEARWNFVDKDESGLVSLEELRYAVWHREEDNKGIPMPAGEFPKALQDVVDAIHQGTGGGPEFSVWDFVRYMLGPMEYNLTETGLVVDEPDAPWSHV